MKHYIDPKLPSPRPRVGPLSLKEQPDYYQTPVTEDAYLRLEDKNYDNKPYFLDDTAKEEKSTYQTLESAYLELEPIQPDPYL